MQRNHRFEDRAIDPKLILKLQNYYLKVRDANEAQEPADEEEVENTAYLLIETMKQRNKRYNPCKCLFVFWIFNLGHKQRTVEEKYVKLVFTMSFSAIQFKTHHKKFFLKEYLFVKLCVEYLANYDFVTYQMSSNL